VNIQPNELACFCEHDSKISGAFKGYDQEGKRVFLEIRLLSWKKKEKMSA